VRYAYSALAVCGLGGVWVWMFERVVCCLGIGNGFFLSSGVEQGLPNCVDSLFWMFAACGVLGVLV